MIGVTVDDDYMEMGAARQALDTHKKMLAAAAARKDGNTEDVAIANAGISGGHTQAQARSGVCVEVERVTQRDRILSEDEYVDMSSLQAKMAPRSGSTGGGAGSGSTAAAYLSHNSPVTPTSSSRSTSSDYADITEFPMRHAMASSASTSSSAMSHFQPGTAALPSFPVSPPDSDSSLPRTPSMPNFLSVSSNTFVAEDDFATMSHSQNGLNVVGGRHPTADRQFATLDSSYRHRNRVRIDLDQAPGSGYESVQLTAADGAGPMAEGESSMNYQNSATLDSSFRHHRKHTAFAGLVAHGDPSDFMSLDGSADLSRSESYLAGGGSPCEVVSIGHQNEHVRRKSLSDKKNWRTDSFDEALDPGRLRRESSDGAIHKVGRGATNYLGLRASKGGNLGPGEKRKTSKSKGLGDPGDEKPGRLRTRLSTLSHGLANKLGSSRSSSPFQHSQSGKKEGSPKFQRKQSVPDSLKGSHLVQSDDFRWQGSVGSRGDRSDYGSANSVQRSPLGSSTSPAPPSPMICSSPQQRAAARTLSAPPLKPKPYHEYKAVKVQLDALSKDTCV